MVDVSFKDRIYSLINQVPEGKVTTYGDLAALAGLPNASLIVGSIAHYGNTDLPWHRLVNQFGGLASGFPGGREIQGQLLKQEGTSCTNFIVDNFESIRWKL